MAAGSTVTSSPEELGLNEVGVTDQVVATLWRCGPIGASFGISSRAETGHVGSDIAILRKGARRIVAYQAKLAWLDDGLLKLKSKVTTAQVNKLNRRSVVLDGQRYAMTGMLALYQTGHTPFLRDRCEALESRALRGPLLPYWDWAWLLAGVGAQRRIGGEYYEMVLVPFRCSPGGVVVADVPSRGSIVTSVRASSTQPWEFHLHDWFRGGTSWGGGGEPSHEVAPEFEPYGPTEVEADPEEASELASQLVEALRLPANHRLHLVVLP